MARTNITQYAVAVICLVNPNNDAGGSHDLNILRDGIAPTTDNTQYDSYRSSDDGTRTSDHWGLLFASPQWFDQLIFTEGSAFTSGRTGGWFTATPTIEVLVNGTWTAVTGQGISPTYAANGTTPYQVYTFTFDRIRGDGIRVIGTPGGIGTYTSCGELEAYMPDGVLYDPPELTSLGTADAFVTNPTGGGNHSLSVISNGVFPFPGSISNGSLQYDSFRNASPNDAGTRTQDWYGYTFAANHEFSALLFQEGLTFGDGGWFVSASIKVQVRVNSVWTDVTGTVVKPAYVGTLGTTPPSAYVGTNDATTYDRYWFLFDPMIGDGIRIFGTPGGSNTFTACAELRVFGDGKSGPVPVVNVQRRAMASLLAM